MKFVEKLMICLFAFAYFYMSRSGMVSHRESLFVMFGALFMYIVQGAFDHDEDDDEDGSEIIYNLKEVHSDEKH
jgi:hypothetical protein